MWSSSRPTLRPFKLLEGAAFQTRCRARSLPTSCAAIRRRRLTFPSSLMWSGSSSALLHRRPLRTGRASHPASGSSHSSAPWCGTEQFDGTFCCSTTSKVRGPRRIKWIGQSSDLDMSRNRDRHCAEEPKPAGVSISWTLRSKVPRPVSVDPEVSRPYPPSSFHGMPTFCPLPEQLPDV